MTASIRKPEAQHREQVAVGRHHGAVDRPTACRTGVSDRERLQREGEHEHLRERALAGPSTGPVRSRRRTRRRSSAGGSRAVGESSSAMPVKCFETSAQRRGGARRRPGSWITAPRASADFSTTKWFRSQCRMHGVRSCGSSLELEAQRARREVQAARDLHQVGERRALERDGEAPAQAGEVDAMAVEARDHAEARQPALGRLGLQEHGQAPRARRSRSSREELHHALPARLSSGSKIHSMSRRRSSRMSASTCMPACRGSRAAVGGDRSATRARP